MTFWRLYYHPVWATKNREEFIQSQVEDRLYGYLVSKASELGVYVYAINGWYDHIHLVVSIPPKHAVATVVKRLKGASSHDLNQSRALDHAFAWQRGYGALTMGETQLPVAETYVTNQKAHHQEQTTNAWLEHCAELDEGPSRAGILPDVVPSIVHERRARYDVWGAPPF